MVILIDSWAMFLGHLESSKGIGLYQVANIGGMVKLRVKVGTLGYEEEFKSENDSDLKTKLQRLNSLLKVTKIVDDDTFFR